MDYINNLLTERTAKLQYVSTQDYMQWLVDFTNIHNYWCDDTFLYKKSEMDTIDYDNTQLISYFQTLVEEKSAEQLVFPVYDDCDNVFLFKLKNNYYKIGTVYGQGVFTSIELLNNVPECDYANFDEEVSEEELKERELIEYIVINKDLLNTISPAKIGVHIGHACTIAALKQQKSIYFDDWYKNGSLQKKIILVAPEKKLEELEKQFYSVRDLGYTEVESNTLIAVSLGIMPRKQAKPYIKRLQLWK